MNKKKVTINIIILMLVMGLTSFYLFKDNGVSKLKSLANLNWYHLVFLSLALAIIFLIEGAIIKIASIGVKNDFSYKDSVVAYSVGNLGSNISPFKSFHYPAIFYSFNKKGLTFEEGLANTTKCSIVYGASTSALYIVLFIIAHINKFTITIGENVVYIEIATLIGLAVNVFQIIFYLTLAYSEKLHNAFIRVASFVLLKFKKIKDKEDYEKTQKLKMKVFKEQVNFFLKHPHHFAVMFFLYLIRVIIFGSLTYLIFLMLAHKEYRLQEAVMFFVLYQAVSYITNIVPTPGGSGGFEFSFILVYNNIIASEYISTTLLVYRSITYFIPTIIEAIIFFFVVWKGKKQALSVSDTVD